MTDHLLLVDASGFAHRAYHAANPSFRSSDGLPTWAITGFLGMMWRMLGAASVDEPTHGAAVFDAPGRTFRHDMFPAYKKNRPARDDELGAQLPFMRHAATALGMMPVEWRGFEADDVIATLAARGAAAGMRVTIVSSDKDFCQLVQDDKIEIVDTLSKRRVREADVQRRFGVPPRLMAQLQALVGDPVDNIPGVDGIGYLMGAGLLRQFGSIEALVNAVEIGNPVGPPPRVRVQLRKAKDALPAYLSLTTLRQDVPLDFVLFDDLVLKPILREHVLDFLKVLEAAPKIETMFGEPVLERAVPMLEQAADPFEWWQEELLAPGQAIPDEPQCGFFERRLVKGGPVVPARIWREPQRDAEGLMTGRDVLLCLLGDEKRDPLHEWSRLAEHPIEESRYRFEIADGAWCREFAPNEPKAQPGRAVDLRALPPPVFEKLKRRQRR